MDRDFRVASRLAGDALRDALGVLVPISCLSCSCEAVDPICPDCASALAGERAEALRWLPLSHGVVPVVSAAPFAGATRSLILALKERNRRSAAGLLAPLLCGSLRELVDVVGESALPSGPIPLVSPPSSYARRFRRGFDPVRCVALAAGSTSFVPVHRVALSRDQAGLGRAARATNLHGAFRVHRALTARHVVLVDDIVTTGATLVELARAVESAGGSVIGAATIAQTPRRTMSSRR